MLFIDDSLQIPGLYEHKYLFFNLLCIYLHNVILVCWYRDKYILNEWKIVHIMGYISVSEQ
jgi:hypothetical protein